MKIVLLILFIIIILIDIVFLYSAMKLGSMMEKENDKNDIQK